MKKELLFILLFVAFSNILSSQTWSTVTPGSQGNCLGIIKHNNKLFISTYSAGPYVSSDGDNWNKANTGLATYGNFGAGISSVGSWLYYGSKDGLYRSSDDGASWTLVNNGLQPTGTPSSKAVAATYMYGSSYFCIYRATISSGGGIYSSTDGINWTASSTGIATNTTVYQIFESGSDLYACTNLELYKSTDNGLNWSVVSPNGSKVYNGMFNHLGRWLIHTTFGIEYSDNNGASWDTLTSSIKSSTACGFVSGTNDTLYAYTASNGVFYSVDTGATWVDITNNLSSNEVLYMSGMAFFNGNLYMPTFLAVKSNGTGTTTAIDELNIENDLQTYPNPFTNEIFINNANNLSLNINLMDVTGKLINTLKSENSKVTVSTSGLSNGIYFVNITDAYSGNVITTKKVIKH